MTEKVRLLEQRNLKLAKEVQDQNEIISSLQEFLHQKTASLAEAVEDNMTLKASLKDHSALLQQLKSDKDLLERANIELREANIQIKSRSKQLQEQFQEQQDIIKTLEDKLRSSFTKSDEDVTKQHKLSFGVNAQKTPLQISNPSALPENLTSLEKLIQKHELSRDFTEVKVEYLEELDQDGIIDYNKPPQRASQAGLDSPDVLFTGLCSQSVSPNTSTNFGVPHFESKLPENNTSYLQNGLESTTSQQDFGEIEVGFNNAQKPDLNPLTVRYFSKARDSDSDSEKLRMRNPTVCEITPPIQASHGSH